MEAKWKVYAAIKRLLFEHGFVLRNHEEEQRFYEELIHILEL